MKKYIFSLFTTVCVTASVFAQDPSEAVGKVVTVEGLVTVSQDNTLGNLVKDSPVVDGARVVTTSTGATTIRLNNGCRIELTFNQAVTINSRLECRALIASVQSTAAGVGAAAAVASVQSTVAGVGAAAAVAVGKAAILSALAAGSLAIGLVARQNSSGS